MEHGSLTVSAGYDADGNSLVTKQTISYTDSSRQDTIHSRTETTTDTVKAVGNAPEDSTPVASSENGLDVLLKKQDSLKELLMSIQQGIHSGVDTYIDVNLQRYDSLLTHVMKEHNLSIPHHTLLIYTGENKISGFCHPIIPLNRTVARWFFLPFLVVTKTTPLEEREP